MLDQVVIEAAGDYLEGWQSVSITRSLNKVAAGFQLTMPRSKQKSNDGMLPLLPGDPVRVFIGGDLVITGHIDVVSARRSDEDHSISIAGRSNTADLVDCSALNSPGQWKDVPLIDIAAALAKPFDVDVVGESDAAQLIIKNFEIEQGEKVSEGIERLARMNSLLVRDNADGDLVLGRTGNIRADVVLMHLDGPDGNPDPRNNVLSSSGSISMATRFSEVTVKGQDASSDATFGTVAASPSASAKDTNVPRHRPLILPADSSANVSDCQRRADWEVVRRLGKSQAITHVVAGWRQKPKGALWHINQIAPVQNSTLGIYGDLLVVEINWSLDEKSGKRTTLKMEPVEAFDPKPVITDSLTVSDPYSSLREQFKGRSS